MAGDGSKSVIKDKVLRRKLAWALCQKINEILNLPSNKAYTEADVDKMMNDKALEERFMICYEAYERGIKNDALGKELNEEVENENINIERNADKGNRSKQHFYKEVKSKEDREYNKEIEIKINNKATRNKVFNDGIQKFFNRDLTKLYSGKEKDYQEEIKNNFFDVELDFNIAKTTEYMGNSNPELIKRYNSISSLVGGSPCFLYYAKNHSIFNILIPQKDLTLEEMITLITKNGELDKVIEEIEPNISEIDMDKKQNPNKATAKQSSINNYFNQLINSIGSMQNIKNNEAFSKLGLFKKDVFINNKLMLNKKEVSSREVLKLMKKATLPRGLKLVPRTKEEQDRLKMYNNTITLKSDIVMLRKSMLDMEINKDLNDRTKKQYEEMKGFLDKFEEFKNKNDIIKETNSLSNEEEREKEAKLYSQYYIENLEKYNVIKKNFEELNKDYPGLTVEAMEELPEGEIIEEPAEIFEEKLEQPRYEPEEKDELKINEEVFNNEEEDALQEIGNLKIDEEVENNNQNTIEEKNSIDYKNSFDRIYNDYKDFNYSDTATRGLQAYSNLIVPVNGAEKEYSKELKALLDSGANKNGIFENYKKQYCWAKNNESIIEALSVLEKMREQDIEYGKRWSITKAWYNKSHNRMLNNRTFLTNTLKNIGVKEEILNKVNTGEDYHLTANDIKESIDSFNKAQAELNKKINEDYEKYIGSYEIKIEELETNLNAQEQVKGQLLTIKNDKRLEVFQKADSSITAENINFLKVETKQKVKNWLNDPENAAFKQDYDNVKNSCNKDIYEINLKITNLNEELKARKQDMKNGIPYNKDYISNKEQLAKIQRKIDDDIKKDDLEYNIQKDSINENKKINEKESEKVDLIVNERQA